MFAKALSKTYFSFSENWSLFYQFDQWLNPVKHSKNIVLGGRPLEICWTNRAQQALEKLDHTMVVEMQLYFSCVVKKRLLFHNDYIHSRTPVVEKLSVDFRVVEPTSCDPEEFAKNYPEKRELDSKAAKRMHVKKLLLDYKNTEWLGEFYI